MISKEAKHVWSVKMIEFPHVIIPCHMLQMIIPIVTDMRSPSIKWWLD